jgi:Uri superfamily endonuclease
VTVHLFPVSFPKKSGIYTLVIDAVQSITSKIGRLKRNDFPQGVYAYTGSARGRSSNLHIRVGRHLRTEKKKWWHIDYFLSSKSVVVNAIVYYLTSLNRECHVSQKIERLNETTPILKGFGSSDCTCGCVAHFHYFPSCTLTEATSKVKTIYHQIFGDSATVLYRRSERNY